MYPTHNLCNMHRYLVSKRTPIFALISPCIPELELSGQLYTPSFCTCNLPQWLPRWMDVGSIHGRREQTCIPSSSTELMGMNWFIFSAKIIDSAPFPSALVAESIRFHKVSDSRLTLRDLYDWINWSDSNIPKKINGIESFPKKNQQIYWVNWLIWLNHLSHS